MEVKSTTINGANTKIKIKKIITRTCRFPGKVP
jgi:hypothetical protein